MNKKGSFYGFFAFLRCESKVENHGVIMRNNAHQPMFEAKLCAVKVKFASVNYTRAANEQWKLKIQLIAIARDATERDARGMNDIAPSRERHRDRLSLIMPTKANNSSFTAAV